VICANKGRRRPPLTRRLVGSAGIGASALVLCTTCFAEGAAPPVPSRARPDLRIGGVVCDYLAHRIWGKRWQQVHPLDVLRENGFDWVRVGVLTRSSASLRATPPAQWGALPWRGEYWSSVEYAGEILREAQVRGLRLNLFFHLSDQAAHGGRQEAPAEWKQLDLRQTADALQQHVYSTTRYYLDHGLHIELYDLGNEIDCGILGFTPGHRIALPPGVDVNRDMDYMTREVWSVEALLLKSALVGLKRADPEAKVVLHVASLARPNGAVFTTSFFRAMVNEGVAFDYVGLSQPYPTEESWPLAGRDCRDWFSELSAVIGSLASLGKAVIFSEAAYPHSPEGIVGAPMTGLPFTPAGQAEWVRRQLAYANSNPHVAGFFYFYPEWFAGLSGEAPTRSLESMGLFATEAEGQPALREFGLRSTTRDSSERGEPIPVSVTGLEVDRQAVLLPLDDLGMPRPVQLYLTEDVEHSMGGPWHPRGRELPLKWAEAGSPGNRGSVSFQGCPPARSESASARHTGREVSP